MFKIGNRVKFQGRGDVTEYGVVIGVDSYAVAVAVGETRIVNLRASAVQYDEGYAKLKGQNLS